MNESELNVVFYYWFTCIEQSSPVEIQRQRTALLKHDVKCSYVCSACRISQKTEKIQIKKALFYVVCNFFFFLRKHIQTSCFSVMSVLPSASRLALCRRTLLKLTSRVRLLVKVSSDTVTSSAMTATLPRTDRREANRQPREPKCTLTT